MFFARQHRCEMHRIFFLTRPPSDFPYPLLSTRGRMLHYPAISSVHTTEELIAKVLCSFSMLISFRNYQKLISNQLSYPECYYALIYLTL